ncbi:MAG: hypothetical protein WDN29_16380 [Methylovirgula sp.]
MAFCQRYYAVLGGGAAETFLLQFYGAAGIIVSVQVGYPRTMRASPTVTQVGTWITGNLSSTALTFLPNVMSMTVDTAALSTTGQFYIYNSNANAFITLSAEL